MRERGNFNPSRTIKISNNKFIKQMKKIELAQKTKKISYIIKVQFTTPVDNQTEFYFGCLSAIYDKFTPQQIGAALSTLFGSKIDFDNPKTTRNCIISKHQVLRKSK